NVRIYDDQGTNLTLFKDFAAATKTMNNGYCSRLAVDRRTETVYLNDGWEGLYRIDDWSNPLAKPLKTSDNKTILGASVAISPDYHLYIRRAGIYNEPVNGPLLRYTTGLTNNPLPFANTGANQVTGAIYSFQGGMLGDGGLDISRFGDVAVFSKTSASGQRCLYIYPDTGSAATGPGRIDVALPSQSFGVRYDRDGNLYVGAKVNNPNQTIPSGFAGDWAYGKTVGSVMKIKRGDTANFTGSIPTGVTKMYTQAISPFSQDRLMGNCICMGPSFELDPYGRLFIPNAITSSVSVADNEGNTILTFGEYGNSDNTGGLAREGNAIASPAIPFGMPTGVVATEDYIYVSDFMNNRLARIQMIYQLDNMPKATVGLDARAKAMNMPIKLSVWPNPANKNIAISLDLPQTGRIMLDIYTADGKHIRNVHSGVLGTGRATVAWDGTDTKGKQVAVGAYFLRLLAGHQVYYKKVVIGK
ncbi:MAG: T9SS type A sorting domain-containing protein, partial [Fibrobacteres bacterium]|nr:T9SS type A sorting domain-containing protein [Fibrobacterota bacterium]